MNDTAGLLSQVQRCLDLCACTIRWMRMRMHMLMPRYTVTYYVSPDQRMPIHCICCTERECGTMLNRAALMRSIMRPCTR